MLKIFGFYCFLYHPSYIHLKKEERKEISTINFFKQKRKKRRSSLKFAGRNQNAIWLSCFYFSFCKSQEDCSSWFTKRKLKNIQIEKCKHTRQAEFQRQTGAKAVKHKPNYTIATQPKHGSKLKHCNKANWNLMYKQHKQGAKLNYKTVKLHY